MLLKDYRKLQYRDFKLEELFEIFELPKSYRNYADFSKRVLIPAIREINERSDILVQEPEIIEKRRKRVIAIRLKFENVIYRYVASSTEEDDDGNLKIGLAANKNLNVLALGIIQTCPLSKARANLTNRSLHVSRKRLVKRPIILAWKSLQSG